ncbi:MAG TPA: hypothetical protein PKJ86_00580 [Candidatus Dojkabacteria bacterium]|nr:hypothetical protein [Candidatus Dojkabacteria bacterium]
MIKKGFNEFFVKIKNYLSKSPLLFASWFGIDSPADSSLSGESGSGTVIVEKIIQLLDFAVVFSSVVAVGFVVWGGVTYMTANGDAEKIKKGTGTIVNALIGLGIIFLSRLIIEFVMKLIIDNL